MGKGPRVGRPSHGGESGKWRARRFSVASPADQVLKSPPTIVIELSVDSSASASPIACRKRVAFPLIRVRASVELTSRWTLATRIRSPPGPRTVATTATFRLASKGNSMAPKSARGRVDKIALPLSSGCRPGSLGPFRAEGT